MPLLLGAAVHGSTWQTAQLWPPEAAVAGVNDHKPSAVPAWSAEAAARFPRCRPSSRAGLTRVLVVRYDGRVRPMSLQEVWRRTHDRSAADDAWVIGFCPPARRPGPGRS